VPSERPIRPQRRDPERRAAHAAGSAHGRGGRSAAFAVAPAFALALALGLGAACGAEPPARGPHVVIVAIDTLRADALGSGGGPPDASPRLDELGAASARFTAAFAHAPWTLPSFASLYTSLPPEAHGAGGDVASGWRALEPAHTTLAERFQDAGYATHAVVNVDFLTAPFGTAQGFDTVDARIADGNRALRRADATTDAALDWVDAAQRGPFLLLVHYFDPHAEYDPPPEFRARFALEQDRAGSGFRFGAREHVVRHRAGQLPLDAATLARARALYQGEVAYTDREVGRLLDGLAARGILSNAIVVVTSDHGEEFGEHGSWEHGHTHHDELLHVPLLIRAPGVAPRAIDEPVGLVDVAPTLCALAGLDIPPAFRGRDLSSALRSGASLPPLAGLAAYGNFWGPALSSWREARWKRIDAGLASRLYDWRADPRELDDRAPSEPDALAASRAAHAAFLRALGASPARRGPAVDLDEATRARIERMGYTGSEGGR
jgi:arylsulfatase A-like enzyme